MQAITDTLGLDLTGFLWHLANYAVLLLALWWVGFRPIMRKLAEREQRVQESLDRAALADAEAAQAERERLALLTAARAEAEAIVAQARAEADRLAVGAAPATMAASADTRA